MLADIWGNTLMQCEKINATASKGKNLLMF